MQSVIDRITRSVTPEALAEPLADAPTPAAETPAATTPDPTAPPALVSEIKSDEPEGEVVLRARDPKTGQFSDMDQSRTYELSIRDKQTGETRVYNKTLPDLMRMAKDGIAMQKSRDELTYYRQAVPEWQQTHSTLQQENEGLRALATELLSGDEALVIQRRNEYAAEHTPDKVLARRQAQLDAREQSLREEAQRRTSAAQQERFAQTIQTVGARIAPIVQEVESLVGPEAAAGKLMRDTLALQVNGQIPPERFQQLEQYIQGPYREWAQAEAAKRSSLDTKRQHELAEAERVRREAQLNANRTGVATRPIGGSVGSTVPAKPAARGMQDVVNNIIRGNGRPAAA